MKRILLISLFMSFFVACTPQMNSLRQADCGAGHYFDEVTRSCILDVSPKAPVITSSSLSITENDAKTTYPITYTDQNGGVATSCTIVDTDTGLNQSLTFGSITIERVNTWANAQDYSNLFIQVVDNPSIAYGNEVVSVSGNTITIEIDAGFTTSSQIVTAINANLAVNAIIYASVTGGNTTESITPLLKVLGATCECANGACEMEIEPSRNISGSTYVDLYITDDDGDSATKRIYINVADTNQAPVVAATRSITVAEDNQIVFTFSSSTTEVPTTDYFDYDGDIASACFANSIHANVQNSNISCTCNIGTGVCTLSFYTDADYFNTSAEAMVEYQIIANGQLSNTGVASALVSEVDDDPVPASTITIAVNEDATGIPGAQTIAGFYFPTASDDGFTGFNASDIRYKLKNLDNYTEIEGSCTGNPGLPDENNYNLLVDDSTYCQVNFEGNANGIYTLEYSVSDSNLPLTSMAQFHGTGYINISIIAQNDPPFITGGTTFTHSMNESTDWNPVSSTISLGNVSDIDDAMTDLSVYFLDSSSSSYVNTMASQASVTGSEGTISDCAIDSSGNISCLYTTLNGNSSNTVGTPDSFNFIVRDDEGAGSAVQTLEVVVLETSDAPVICNYSTYNLRSGRTECGVNHCIGEGAPTFAPTSHLSTDPVIYFDRTNMICYQSNSTTSSGWEVASNNGNQNASYMSDIVIGEKENVIIDNVILSEGGSVDEGGQTLTIQNIASTNSILINPSNITFFNDIENDNIFDEPSTITVTGPGGGNIDNINAFNENLRIKMIPTASQFGETTISFDIVDSGTGTLTTSISFNVRVEPQTITHNGWEDVKALGVKVNHYGTRAQIETTCSHSLTKCNGGDECYGTSSPVAAVIPDAPGAIYRSSSDNKCYYSTGTTAADWVLFNKQVACNISEVNRDYINQGILEDSSTTCDTLNSASCIGDVTFVNPGSTQLTVTFNATTSVLDASLNKGKFLFNTLYNASTKNDCYYSDGTTWTPYHGTSTVKLDWEAFTVNTSGAIQGYNVYRKLAGKENLFNYDMPLNREIISSTTTSYIDNGENSRIAPAPNHTYVYEVRPVLSFTNQLSASEELEITTNNNVAKLRVIAPQENYTFVHRWMVNKKACEMMHSESFIDNDYKCEYKGFGDSDSNGLGTINAVYDFGKDLLVPKFEMGCPFTKTGCDTVDGQCVAQNLVNNSTPYTGASGSIFYERSTGACYRHDGSSFVAYNGEDLDAEKAYQAYLPPLTNIDYTQATAACSALTANTIIGYTAGLTFDLPTRDEQIAYTAWDLRNPSGGNYAESVFETRERGQSLNSSSKCNSNLASGLESSYMDVDTLSSTDVHTIPGTYSSGIRSLHTGSTYTEDCSSMFGIQDAVGNVAEFSRTEYTYDNTTFTYDFPSITSATDSTIYGTGGTYGFEGISGPCADTDGDGFCDSEMGSFLFEDKSTYSTGYFNYVYGIPITNDAQAGVDGTSVGDYTLRIGSSAGITSAQLHDDAMFRELPNTASGTIVSGGDYQALNESGVYTLEMFPDGEANSRVGVRCVIEVDPTNYEAE